MASTLLSFENVSEDDVYEFSNRLRDFWESVIDRKYWKENNPDRFGPILYIGPLKDPYDGNYSIFLQSTDKHSKTLFCTMDAFLDKCRLHIEYERSDK